MANAGTDEKIPISDAPLPVQVDEDIEAFIQTTGISIAPEVTRHIFELLRNGVRPANIFMLLQTLAKKNAEMDTGKNSLVSLDSKSSESSKSSLAESIPSGQDVRVRSKPMKAWALKAKPSFSKDSAKG